LNIEAEINEICKNDDFSKLHSKNILITGGAGFIGSWLCEIFLKLDCKVFCLDDLSSGSNNNILHLQNHKNFVFINSSSEQPLDDSISYDIIIHLAGRPSPEDYVQFPVETLAASTKGTFNMLELAKKQNSIFFLTSTSEVYGDPSIIPTPESYWGHVNPIGVRSCYDEGKRVSEALAIAFFREFGLSVKIARIFNTYGPRIRADGAYGRVVPRFILRALEGKNLNVHGDGLQTRSFCYISDTVRGIMKCLTNNEINGKPVNIGNTNEITILVARNELFTYLINSADVEFVIFIGIFFE